MMTPKIRDPGIRIATLVLGVKYGQQGGGRVDSGSYQQSRMVRTHVLPYTPHPPHKYTHIHTCCQTNKQTQKDIQYNDNNTQLINRSSPNMTQY